ncbi:MAG TPA: hypothetical protein PLH02_05960 [Bacillota bacterium]|nr:hypothetical protein [Bacillota bacterium]HPF42888.1 hypothetical protein [Bacillota bacterium]HPJ86358.1 hypothetical protein [Bacillota bacterium]HPQ62388.1 hypothetical protein [Bacillota bacterium]HRX92079.1 hypothetical protein [Candidatus Izemoplasmatales bacterium]
MKTNIRAIVASILFMVFAALVVVGFTYGWFSFGTIYTTNHVNVGNLEYTLSGAFLNDNSVVVPGEDLVVDNFSINNESSVSSQLRIKITYTRVTDVGGTPTPEQGYVYKGDSDDHIAVIFMSTFLFTDGDATPDEYDDDYWYYGDYATEINAESGVIDLISNIHYDGDSTSTEYNGQTIAVTVLIEVKQADNVTWSELATYNFETGYPIA